MSGLKDTTDQALIALSGTLVAVTTIGAGAKVPAQISLTNTGTVGNWLVSLGGVSVTSTSYSRKLTPGESWTEDDPPKGAVTALHDSPGSGGADKLAYYLSYV